MPKSKVRKKAEFARPTTSPSAARGLAPSPTWYPIVMAVLLLLGLAYIVAYYLAGQSIPGMQNLGAWNFAVGFGLMILGLVMAVKWR